MKKMKKQINILMISMLLMSTLLTGCKSETGKMIEDQLINSQSVLFDFSENDIEEIIVDTLQSEIFQADIFQSENQLDENVSIDCIPKYSGESYVTLNNNIPYFEEDQLGYISYEKYADLDSLGRNGTAVACIGPDLMPTEERESISDVYPAGWEQEPYDFIDGGWLYNRCHIIGFQLTGENANEKNLMTGTRYFNTEGMLLFENKVAEYIHETSNHVMYRVTPIYQDNNLVADGVTMEAFSVEDNGEGICFNVFCYNIQPGVEINYATGENYADGTM